jgi:hypothetical protein
MSVGTLQFMPSNWHMDYSCSARIAGRLPIRTCVSTTVLSRRRRKAERSSGLSAAIRSSMTCGSLTALPLTVEQHVAGADAGDVGRAAAHDAGDQRAFVVRQAEGLGQFGGDLLGFDADPAARDGAGLDDLFHDVLALDTGIAKPMPSEPPVRE